MTKIRTVLMCLVVVLITCAFTMPPASLGSNISADVAYLSPAAETLVKFTFVNKTGATIPLLTLEGPQTYYFYNVPIGQSKFFVAKGKYLIKYPACGRDRSKNLSITSNVKFTTVNCPVVKLTIKNLTGGTLYLYLDGPVDYRFTLLAGNTKITILKGTYDYTAYANCGFVHGTKKFKNSSNWYWWCK